MPTITPFTGVAAFSGPRTHKVRLAACMDGPAASASASVGVVGVVVVHRLGDADTCQAPVRSPDNDKYHASPPLGFELAEIRQTRSITNRSVQAVLTTNYYYLQPAVCNTPRPDLIARNT
ncbi:hypothetical protein NOR_06842 [Metarhizium rileyi]|uniref:Uncharacterized protein n=1 Tax=Metarhizium rileyi (strain RCEF 4871) TaxID=1649241 RepID=A0A166ZNS3_METRR|nr:hypothetical protein NOR_06842 [Metarhizium rileyi RCEF 4871]TWU73703.1 hypothetical protein ED733_004940 [Metarhizium rileyi]